MALAAMLTIAAMGLVPRIAAPDRPSWSTCGQDLCYCVPDPACPLCETAVASDCRGERSRPVFRRAEDLGAGVQLFIASCVVLLGSTPGGSPVVAPTPSGLASSGVDLVREAWRAAPEPPPPRALA